MEPSPSELLQVVRGVIDEASRTVHEHHGPIHVERKADDSVVTELDRAIQDKIIANLRSKFEGHAVVAEEATEKPRDCPEPASARFVWVIDPLDGTRNFCSGFPCFATSVALLDRGEPIVAAVYEHKLGQCYTAIRGEGAALDGQPIRCREWKPPDDRLVGIPSSKDGFAVGVVRAWAGEKGIILRNLGATTVHLALVACGGLSAAFGVRSKIWDLAAGALIVREAGGRITDPQGRELVPFHLAADANADLPFLAAGPALHEQLLASLARLAAFPT